MLGTFLIANHQNNQILYQFNNNQIKKNIKDQTSIIISKISSIKSKVGERKKLPSEFGRWLLVKNQDNFTFAVCVQEDYPERLGYGVIQKIRTFVKDKNINKQNIKKISNVKKELNTICQKYRDAKADKVKQAQAAVEDLQGQLNKGIKKVFDNHENLDKLTDRTSLIKNYAKQFEKGAQIVQHQAFMKKWRIYFLIGFILAAIFVTIGLSLYARDHK